MRRTPLAADDRGSMWILPMLLTMLGTALFVTVMLASIVGAV
jgi:hypothetical protein